MNDELKERVRAAVNLADWIRGEGLPLKGGPNEFKCLCPFHQEKTPSFTVVNKDGSWFFYCHGCDASGDIFEWVMRRKGISFPQALRLVANAMSIAVPEKLYQPTTRDAGASSKEADRGVFDPDRYRPLVPGGKVWKYLTEQRKLDAGLLVDYGVGETADGEAYAFSYKWRPEGWPAERKPKFEFAKVVKVDRPAGKKEEWRDPKGGKNILFGMCAPGVQSRHLEGGELVICEGEIDAVSWAQYGFAAVSVPGGAKYTGWIDFCFEWLQAFKKIHVAFDEDAAGRLKVVEIVNRLGIERADIVRLPTKDGTKRFKDINECLQAGVPKEEIAYHVSTSEIITPPKLKDIYAFEQEIWDKFHSNDRERIGLVLPWGNSHGSSLSFRFRYGEVSVWTGYNKHGKSEVLNHVIVDLCWQGEKALMCSLEVQAPETYRKLIRMAMGRKNVCSPEERAQFRDKCLKPLAQKIWVYDHVGFAPLEDVLNVMLYAFQRFGCRQFVLDSLMQFENLDGEGQDQWTAQKDFMQALDTFAKKYNVHIHLVAHSRKPEKGGENIIPRRYNIMGSSYISNKPSNVIVVWRNRKKQDKLEEIFQACSEAWIRDNRGKEMPTWKRLLGGPPGKNTPPEFKVMWNAMLDTIEKGITQDQKDEFQSLVLEHDAYFIVDAQRGGDGDCPARHLWFHYDSLQFLEASPWKSMGKDPRSQPRNYVEQQPTTTEPEPEEVSLPTNEELGLK
jgi:twinkle protein